MMKKILGLFISLMMASQAFASIAVAPMRLEINANKIKGNYLTTSVNVTGDPHKVMRFKVSSGYFTLNDKSELNIIEEKTQDPHDLSGKIRFVPSEFNVQPGKSQRVRLNIINLNQLPDGESRAILFIEDVDPKEFNLDTGRAGYGAQLIVKTRLGVPIYLDKGKVSKVGDIEYFKITKEKDGLYTEAKINSTGNSKIRYTGKVQIIKDKKLIDEYNLTGHPVGHGNHFVTKDKIKTDKITGAGEYTLRLVITYEDGNGKKQNLKQEAVLSIKGEI